MNPDYMPIHPMVVQTFQSKPQLSTYWWCWWITSEITFEIFQSDDGLTGRHINIPAAMAKNTTFYRGNDITD